MVHYVQIIDRSLRLRFRKQKQKKIIIETPFSHPSVTLECVFILSPKTPFDRSRKSHTRPYGYYDRRFEKEYSKNCLYKFLVRKNSCPIWEEKYKFYF